MNKCTANGEPCAACQPFHSQKSDHFQTSPTPSPEIFYHTVWRTWLFVAYSDERWFYHFSLPHLYIFHLVWPLHSKEWSIITFSYSLTGNITSHSMRNLAFHSLLRWKMITLPILTTSLFSIHFPLKGWENVLYELGSVYRSLSTHGFSPSCSSGGVVYLFSERPQLQRRRAHQDAQRVPTRGRRPVPGVHVLQGPPRALPHPALLRPEPQGLREVRHQTRSLLPCVRWAEMMSKTSCNAHVRTPRKYASLPCGQFGFESAVTAPDEFKRSFDSSSSRSLNVKT